jgi:hypothetical protein
MTATLASAFACLAAGMLIGSLYWLTLRWSVERLATRQSMALAIVVQLVRLAALGAFLAFVAMRWGALPLLLTAGGLMFARAAVLRLNGRG